MSADAETTYVGGRITIDTVWSKENSPYIISEDVIVAPDVSLTIEPGVEIQFDGHYRLWVQGSLYAQGTETNEIVFTRYGQDNWDRIYIDLYGFTLIEYTVIEYADIGLCVNSNLGGRGYGYIYHSTVRNSSIGIDCQANGIFHITYNVIEFNGVGVRGAYYSDILCNTIFSNSGDGIQESGLIQYNTISENGGYGINTGGCGHRGIKYNTVIDNAGGGIREQNSYAVATTYNNICSNGGYAYEYLRSNDAGIVTNNWWGTTNTTTIDLLIYDWNDDANLGVVQYVPFLSAVSIIPTPTPTTPPIAPTTATATAPPTATATSTPSPNTPTPTAAPTATPTSVPTITPTTSPTSTATQTVTPTPTPTTTPTITPILTPNASVASSVVGINGSNVQTSDGKIEVSFPAGAFNTSTTVTITGGSGYCHNASDGFVVGNTCFSVTPSGELGAPATICVNLSPSELSAFDNGSEITLGYWSNGIWNLASNISINGNMICGETTHLSDWAVLGATTNFMPTPSPAPTPTATPTNTTSQTDKGNTNWPLIGGIVGVVLLLLGIIVVIYFRNRRQKTSKKKRRPNQRPVNRPTRPTDDMEDWEDW